MNSSTQIANDVVQTIGQRPFLSFVEGNPGIPGNGEVVTSQAGINPFFLELSEPIPVISNPNPFISAENNGMTIAFFGGHQPITYVTVGISAPKKTGACAATFGLGLFRDSNTTFENWRNVAFNGTSGTAIDIRPYTLQFLIDSFIQTYPQCAYTQQDFVVSSLRVEESIVTFTIDAAAITPYQGAFR